VCSKHRETHDVHPLRGAVVIQVVTARCVHVLQNASELILAGIVADGCSGVASHGQRVRAGDIERVASGRHNTQRLPLWRIRLTHAHGLIWRLDGR